METSHLLLVIAILGGCIVTWIIRKLLFEKDFISKTEHIVLESKASALALEKGKLEERYSLLMEMSDGLRIDFQQRQSKLDEANASIGKLQAVNGSLQERLDNQKEEIGSISQKFELLARRILDETTLKFGEMQETSLKDILDPLRTNIKEFKEEFQSKLNNEAKEKGSLSEQIRQMMDLNKNLSTQADNLTRALSNNVKQQGDWGEEILESILEYAGLQKDIQYFVQYSTQNNDGTTIRPDILVKYPDGRSIVIDSKVSLVHHTRYCAAETSEEQAIHLGQSINSLKQHIDGLSRKNYQDITDALDLIIMFVPNEAAYISAMYADHELWQYAYKKRVMLISPTNLIPAMKLVADMWQKDAIGKNAMEIADKAGKLYDKLAGFVENFEKVGGQIEKAHSTWADAQKQLHRGKGNLISQAEQMKKLHLKTSKQISEKLVDEALLEDGLTLDEERLLSNKKIEILN